MAKGSFWEGLFRKKNPIGEVPEINTLREQLIQLGFPPSEIEYPIRQATGQKRASRMDAADIEKIKEALQTQLDIARKCINLIN